MSTCKNRRIRDSDIGIRSSKTRELFQAAILTLPMRKPPSLSRRFFHELYFWVTQNNSTFIKLYKKDMLDS